MAIKAKSLEIKTCAIEIHVVRVDGHKMTKATFDQIEESNTLYDIYSCKNLGYVRIKNSIRWVLYENEGRIYKTRIGYYRNGLVINNGEDWLPEKWWRERNPEYYESVIKHFSGESPLHQLFIAT